MPEQITNADQQRLAKAGISIDRLRSEARTAAQGHHVVHRPQTKTQSYGMRVEAARASLERLLADLDTLTAESVAGPDPLLEIRENPRLLRTAAVEVKSVIRKVRHLPVEMHPDGADEPRAAAVAAGYLSASGLAWDPAALHIYINEEQQTDPLFLEELWVLPVMLRLVLLERILAGAEERRHAGSFRDDESAKQLTAAIKSLRETGYADWPSILEPMVAFDAALQKDPAGAYPRMDFDSREVCRKRVAEIARHADSSESEVAAAALELAAEAAQRPAEDIRLHERRAHVGYYLFDQGFEQLRLQIGWRPRFIDRLRMTIHRHADDFYIGGIEIMTVILIAAILLPLIPNYSVIGGLTFAFLLLLLPATQGAVDLLNNTTTALFRAHPLLKLDYSKGIPEECATLVVVPTLLMHEKQVRELVLDLEIRFLANQDPNLHFALLTDLPDSVSKPGEKDSDPLVILAVRLINELNEQYRSHGKHGAILLLHRHRIFNARQGVWMGWERKRGKLLDLNKLLAGQFDAFPVKAGNMEILQKVKYIITLDSDTQLPRGTAHGMIGTMAHPLNRAIIDPQSRIVSQGYGILQPRVGVSVHSASRSRLASLYSGQTGFDLYTRAVSDAYQDLYGEGSFTGKGIYEAATLHAVLDRRFPRNSLLSHDLIEGAYARAGLVTDIEVIDDYPSHYSAWSRRKHRWVRGDWQIAQWLFSRVPDESGRWVRNPISTISRWKIFDNLRRSLVEPLTLILLVAGWLGLPGGALYWTLVTLFLLFVPTLLQLAFGVGRAMFIEQQGAVREALLGFWQSLFITLLNLAFLPHQTMLSIDAIIRSLVRRFITGQRLLEWETAAEAESSKGLRTPVDRYLALTALFSLALAIVVAFFRPISLLVAAPILLLWGFESGVTEWLNSPPREEKQAIRTEDEGFLREHALRIWRFFHEFGGARHNYLIPDNVEEEGLFEAARVSPTNFGLLLNARQAAVELGFLTIPEFTDLMLASYATVEKLPRYRGHLYNWYNTHTLEPLQPITVSSVDSGNLAASYYTVRTGARSLLQRPLIDARLFAGIRTQWLLLRGLKTAPAEIKSLALPGEHAEATEWMAWIARAAELPFIADAAAYTGPSADEAIWWMDELRNRLLAISAIVRDYLPWLHSDYAFLLTNAYAGLQNKGGFPVLEESADFSAALEQRLAMLWAMLSASEANGNSHQAFLVEKLRSELPAARARMTELADRVRTVSAEALRLAEEMDFAFLADEGRQLLSIGYELATSKVHWACYDMLASEARIATYIAVARGELPQQGWFRMSRTHTQAYGRPVLLSWTGTMFEYLMPSVWMHSYPETLISKSLVNAVEIQRAFGREHGIPWGISESGYAKKDDAGHYHYQAFGIPQIALKWDAEAGPLISPYSTYLALGVAPVAAVHNLRRMEASKWKGIYGLYEAADYSESLKHPSLVREWMAHHLGMSLLALLNLLDDAAVQRWFHANPQMQAVELLLHEKPLRAAQLRAEFKQLTPTKKRPGQALKKAS
ncbi:glucoamylase family protein [Paracidobacterium acidisoli]|uniref:Glycosyl transferase n=1 Tax=Paracidobacterium acidisoli TaxID=2303751 RepID=A0A372IL34_9BACT|nr:glucoamylase family protein [Paracidobacterium acidisoli]MBT9332209.1 glycosyl transferase [Paracidobacterium acidisoli]